MRTADDGLSWRGRRNSLCHRADSGLDQKGTCGCFIDVLNPMLVGTKVRIKLHWGQEAFETTGNVASVDPGHGMGLEFTKEISVDQLDVLERWLVGERNN